MKINCYKSRILYKYLTVLVCIFLVEKISFVQAQTKQQQIEEIKIKPGKNDYFTIQQALAHNKSEYLKIILDGKFVIDKTLVSKRNNTTLEFTKGSQITMTARDQGILLILHDNCTVQNGRFIGNGQSTTNFYTGFGVQLSDTENSKVIDCSFEKISGISIFLSFSKKGCKNSLIKGNRISQPAMYIKEIGDEAGILLGYSGNNYFHENNIITLNEVDGNNILKIGVGIIGHGKNNTFSSNKVSNCLNYGIISYESAYTDVSLTGTKILDNEIRNIGETGNRRTVKGMGIYLMKSMNSEVIGNKVYNTLRNSDQTESLGAGAIAISCAINAKVSNNLIDGSYMYGFVNDYSFNSNFSSNFVKNTRKSAVLFVNVNDVLVDKNHFENIGEVVFKGRFENTGLEYIKNQWKIKTYLNQSTGKNIKIENNIITSDKDLLFFKGTNRKEQNIENKIKNNTFVNNTIRRSSQTPVTNENVAFREVEENTNISRNNKVEKK
ncbi:right-handed parallel beta-helix repeat-containing protein [Chryseobacterium arthrosphaerae]|uniref:right-handed parallel beta-helix repeat-containing protein n=1 Tax=Chryseobacterium arthrosphaerae TaxID=651561 RepID=UPI001E37095A|nr:right-handed parallel beta-helix repeat-containing protein [Chryseobacterium arthrosphaerae]UEQ78727.1 hypothetical protein J8N07_10635 [Chryseobacterium arthrosphaerae]